MLLRCVDKVEAEKIMVELHKGTFGTNSSGHTMAKKILWPNEKGANTFLFHNLPSELKKTISKVFPVIFTLSLLDKRKVSGDSCYP